MDNQQQTQTQTQQRKRSVSPITSFIRWLRLKNYQYEVSSSLYMLSRTEKIIFNVIILVLISMLLTAAFHYLPNHLSLISNRVYYYVMGELSHISSTSSSSSNHVIGNSVVEGLTSIVKKTQLVSTTRMGEL